MVNTFSNLLKDEQLNYGFEVAQGDIDLSKIKNRVKFFSDFKVIK